MSKQLLILLLLGSTTSWAANDGCHAEILKFEKWANVSMAHFHAFSLNLASKSAEKIQSSVQDFIKDKDALNKLEATDAGLKEVKNVFGNTVDGQIVWGLGIRRVLLDQQVSEQDEAKITEAMQIAKMGGAAALTMLKVFKAQPCRSPASQAPADAATQFKSWTTAFRATTEKVDQLMSSIADPKTSAAHLKSELEKLSNYWRDSIPYINSTGTTLGLTATKAKALYAEEVKLMLEMSKLTRMAIDSGKLTPEAQDRLQEISAITRILGRVADRLANF